MLVGAMEPILLVPINSCLTGVVRGRLAARTPARSAFPMATPRACGDRAATMTRFFERVNGIGTADATPAAQKQVAADVIAAYEQIITRTHATGIRVYGATSAPFGAHTPTTTRTATGRRSGRRSTPEHERPLRQRARLRKRSHAIRSIPADSGRRRPSVPQPVGLPGAGGRGPDPAVLAGTASQVLRLQPTPRLRRPRPRTGAAVEGSTGPVSREAPRPVPGRNRWPEW
ncbi:hypothetical protein GA0115254_116032 [Streptomyces sp. Ncost-T10-10d]|nr:hypothetical protein GA0115254_116032 [Streptomyces sp. Ncost-T10-10d]